MSFLSFALPLSLLILLSASVTHAVRGYALRRLLDMPNARSSHSTPTPRGGGLAIVVAFSLAVAVLYGLGRVPFDLFMALAGALPMAAVGFWDDHGHVPARWRFLVHVGCAAWALYWLGGFPSIFLGGSRFELGWAGNLLGGFFIVWFLNLFNFMDGIDGIAGVEAISVAVSAALLAGFTGAGEVWLALAAATAGFLAWNWPPAKIFMGDVGSGFVGFLLGVFAVHSAAAGEPSLTVWLILAGVFFVDATVTLLRRMAAGQRWYEAHRSHAYQHAAVRCGSHRRVTLAVLAINLLWLLPLAAGAVVWPRWEAAFLALAYTPLVGLALRLDAGKS
jgi:Fuc2NAc and GlcNAc transferase